MTYNICYVTSLPNALISRMKKLHYSIWDHSLVSRYFLTPKFHAELAGEGIEFSWGHAKSFYRRVPVSQKRGRENFKRLVRDSTCPINELTTEWVEKFAARARAYICTYHHVFEMRQRRQQQHQASESIKSLEDQGLLLSDIQRLTKLFKSHRCALDFDRGFVNSALKEANPRNKVDNDDDVV